MDHRPPPHSQKQRPYTSLSRTGKIKFQRSVSPAYGMAPSRNHMRRESLSQRSQKSEERGCVNIVCPSSCNSKSASRSRSKQRYVRSSLNQMLRRVRPVFNNQ